MVFMGSDPIALPSLEAICSGKCGEMELVAIYTQPDRPRGRGQRIVPNEIKQWALEKGFPVFQPEKMDRAERLKIAELNLDSALVMAYGHMLSQRLINTPRYGTWNLHTSILPKYRGASPIQAAIASGDRETGVSLMKLVREMDAGPVLDVERVCIGDEDTALNVEEKLAAACVPLLARGLQRVHGGSARTEAQDSAEASYVRKLDQRDGELDFRASAAILARRINGLFPWPGTRARLEDTVVKVGLAVADSAAKGGEPGLVMGMEDGGLRVACGEGVVLLKRLQRPGGKMLSAVEFGRGFAIPEGAVFESRVMTDLVATRPGAA